MTVAVLEKLLTDLTAWCSEGWGRQSRVAEHLNCSRGLVNDWLKRRRMPNVEQYLTLQAFLKKQRRRH